MSSRAASIVAAVLCFITALSLQIQITLFTSAEYLGLRVNLTDLVVSVAGLAIVATLLTKQSQWPKWRIKHLYLWLAGLTALLAFAMAQSYWTYAEISRWALVNKFGGWIVLLSIMGMGAWVATNADKRSIERFVKIFLGFFLIVSILELALILAVTIPAVDNVLPYRDFFYYPAEILMANRNAAGFLLILAFGISSCFYFSNRSFLPKYLMAAFCALMPLCLYLNGSRAALITFLFVFASIIIVYRADSKRLFGFVLLILAGVILAFGLTHGRTEKLIPLPDRIENRLGGETQNSKIYEGDSIRLAVLRDAIDMARENPIFGSGLGAALIHQEKTHGSASNLIDSTPLWILAEMGAAGLLLFATFYFKIAQVFYHSWKDAGDDFQKALYSSLLLMMFAFAIMSLFHEILYTRFLWFFLGLGLALPVRMRQDV